MAENTLKVIHADIEFSVNMFLIISYPFKFIANKSLQLKNTDMSGMQQDDDKNYVFSLFYVNVTRQISKVKIYLYVVYLIPVTCT